MMLSGVLVWFERSVHHRRPARVRAGNRGWAEMCVPVGHWRGTVEVSSDKVNEEFVEIVKT